MQIILYMVLYTKCHMIICTAITFKLVVQPLHTQLCVYIHIKGYPYTLRLTCMYYAGNTAFDVPHLHVHVHVGSMACLEKGSYAKESHDQDLELTIL